MKTIISIYLLLFASASLAQDESPLDTLTKYKVRAPRESEFTGYWRIILIPDEKMHLRVKNKDTGFDSPCQFFIHKADGKWLNISISIGSNEQETRDLCPRLTRNDIDSAIAKESILPLHNWKQIGAGIFQVRDTMTGYDSQTWAADYVPEDITLGDYFDFKKGDTIMNMAAIAYTNPATNKSSLEFGMPPFLGAKIILAWRMVLRPVAAPKTSPTPIPITSITAQQARHARPNRWSYPGLEITQTTP